VDEVAYGRLVYSPLSMLANPQPSTIKGDV